MTLFNMAPVITALSSQAATKLVRGADTFDSNGRLSSTAYASAVNITVNIQPTGGKDLMRLPEGLREMEVVTIYSVDSLENADRVVTGGVTYQIEGSANWNPNGNYYKAIARKLGATES